MTQPNIHKSEDKAIGKTAVPNDAAALGWLGWDIEQHLDAI